MSFGSSWLMVLFSFSIFLLVFNLLNSINYCRTHVEVPNYNHLFLFSVLSCLMYFKALLLSTYTFTMFFLKKQIFFGKNTYHEIYLLNRFFSVQYNTVIKRHRLYIRSLELIRFTKLKFHIFHWLATPHFPPAPGKHLSILCFYEFAYFRYIK